MCDRQLDQRKVRHEQRHHACRGRKDIERLRQNQNQDCSQRRGLLVVVVGNKQTTSLTDNSICSFFPASFDRLIMSGENPYDDEQMEGLVVGDAMGEDGDEQPNRKCL